MKLYKLIGIAVITFFLFIGLMTYCIHGTIETINDLSKDKEIQKSIHSTAVKATAEVMEIRAEAEEMSKE